MPAYQETKPLATDKLSDSQADIANNFTAIKALVDVNHETFNSGASPEGKHIKADFTNSATHPAVAATDVLLYNYLNALTAQQELYAKRTGALATEGIPITAGSATSQGWTYLPSGIILKWGSSTTPVSINLNGAAYGPAMANAGSDSTYPVFATFRYPFPAGTLASLLSTRVVSGGTTLDIRSTPNGMVVFFFVICWA